MTCEKSQNTLASHKCIKGEGAFLRKVSITFKIRAYLYLKGPAVLDCVGLEDKTDRLSRNVGN
jgi:hypothetical protein